MLGILGILLGVGSVTGGNVFSLVPALVAVIAGIMIFVRQRAGDASACGTAADASASGLWPAAWPTRLWTTTASIPAASADVEVVQ